MQLPAKYSRHKRNCHYFTGHIFSIPFHVLLRSQLHVRTCACVHATYKLLCCERHVQQKRIYSINAAFNLASLY